MGESWVSVVPNVFTTCDELGDEDWVTCDSASLKLAIAYAWNLFGLCCSLAAVALLLTGTLLVVCRSQRKRTESARGSSGWPLNGAEEGREAEAEMGILATAPEGGVSGASSLSVGLLGAAGHDGL